MTHTVRAHILYTRWSRQSVSGNPQFDLYTEGGSFHTEPDAQVNYHISESTKGDHVLTLNEHGKVIGAVVP